jgi:hypothetical protein
LPGPVVDALRRNKAVWHPLAKMFVAVLILIAVASIWSFPLIQDQ